MNIYKKLQTVRVALQKKAIKKSGHNKFAGYYYYELGDFIPTVNELMLEHGLCAIVSFTSGLATMTIFDTDSDVSEKTIVFTSPMSEANLKGCHPVQNLGAVESYERRYLYQTAFEIVESDVLDATTGKPGQTLSKPIYSEDTFANNLKAWSDRIANGDITNSKLIEMIETKYTLSDEQKTVLKKA
jgi:hypothetical protein